MPNKKQMKSYYISLLVDINLEGVRKGGTFLFPLLFIRLIKHAKKASTLESECFFVWLYYITVTASTGTNSLVATR